jgi:hypothetical protein
MMTNEQTKIIVYEEGRRQALALQDKSSTMTGTELNAADNTIPTFLAAKSVMNMLKRNIGFVCKTSAGRVVRLLQPYDSDIFKAEPEELSAQWGFAWSDDPAKAKPFVSIATSPYMTGNCCSENELIYRSKMDNNTWSPSDYPDGWEIVE